MQVLGTEKFTLEMFYSLKDLGTTGLCRRQTEVSIHRYKILLRAVFCLNYVQQIPLFVKHQMFNRHIQKVEMPLWSWFLSFETEI